MIFLFFTLKHNLYTPLNYKRRLFLKNINFYFTTVEIHVTVYNNFSMISPISTDQNAFYDLTVGG